MRFAENEADRLAAVGFALHRHSKSTFFMICRKQKAAVFGCFSLLLQLSAQDESMDVQLVVQQDDVRQLARFERAVIVLDTDSARRIGAGCAPPTVISARRVG